MIEMTLQQAEDLVEGNENIEWDGWDLVFYRPGGTSAVFKKNGVFRDDQWMLKDIIAVNERGTYVVSNKHAKLLTKIRH